MLNKIILSMIMALFCVACSDKKATSDVDTTENSAKCRENPNATGCKSTKDEPCEKLSGVDVCIDNLPPNIVIETYSEGDVAPFHWQNTLAWYYETENYSYGFDMDPMANWSDHIDAGKDVYVSVAKGEPASVDLKVPSEFIKSVSLVNDDGVEVCSAGKCQGTLNLNAGNYKLKNGDVDLDRNLHVIAYEKKEPYEITYVQFDDVNASCTDPGCYSKQSVQKNLNKVFSQAVLSANVNEVEPSDLGLDEVFEFDATEDNYETVYNKLENILFNNEKIYTEFKSVKDKQDESYRKYKEYGRTVCNESCTDEGCSYSCFQEEMDILKELRKQYDADKIEYESLLYSKGVRLVVALNSFRIIWRLNEQPTNELNLKHYYDFLNAYWVNQATVGREPAVGSLIPMSLKSYPACKSGVGGTPVPVFAKLNSVNKSDNTFSVSLQNGSGKPVSFDRDCDYLYVDTYSFLPGRTDAYSGAAEITESYSNDENKIYAAYIIAPRQIGVSSQNTIVHEIGHSFGLSDLYVYENDPSVPYCLDKSGDGRYFYSGPADGVTGDALVDYLSKRKCNFATMEADIMNYIVPTGPKLRYRLMQITKTGNNVETGKYESQWECLQNADCAKYK